MKHKMFLMVFDGVLVVILCVLVLGVIRRNQLGIHTVRNYVAGWQVGSFDTTNPVYYTMAWRYVATNGTVVQMPERITNYYWRVWSIWR